MILFLQKSQSKNVSSMNPQYPKLDIWSNYHLLKVQKILGTDHMCDLQLDVGHMVPISIFNMGLEVAYGYAEVAQKILGPSNNIKIKKLAPMYNKVTEIG